MLLDGLMQSDNIFRKGINRERGTIVGYNIKEIENECPTNQYKFGGLGLFIDILRNDNITKMTCIWSLSGRQAPGGYCNPPTGFHSFDASHSLRSPISTLLVAFGLEETKDLIGAKVKIKRNSTSIRIAPEEKPISKNKKNTNRLRAFIGNGCIEGGAWVFADLFEFWDIEPLIADERMNDLISLNPDMRDELVTMRTKLVNNGYRRIREKEESEEAVSDKDKKIGLTDLFDSLSDLQINISGEFYKLFEKYPEAKIELDNLKNRLHDSFSTVDETSINLK